jgi:hypothetical protein
MQLDREHARARRRQGSGQRAVAGTKIENQITGPDAGPGNDVFGVFRPKPMPSPVAVRPGLGRDPR